jgi:hypothetical protein
MGRTGVPSFVDGRSLLPVADGTPPANWRTALLSYHWRWDGPLKSGVKPEWWALMTGQRTYVEYETGEREFYRLDTDPYELQNAYETLSGSEAEPPRPAGEPQELRRGLLRNSGERSLAAPRMRGIAPVRRPGAATSPPEP